MVSAAMPPIAVYLGAVLVNRIADARVQALDWRQLLPIIAGLWAATGVQRAIGAYMGYGRNLFVRRVQLEAERRLLAMVNRDRGAHNLATLQWDDRVAAVSRAHSEEMKRTKNVAHISPTTGSAADRVRAARIKTAVVLENVALRPT